MPFVHVLSPAGASSAQKRRLIAGITDALCEAYDITPDIVTIYVAGVAPEDYGHGGRQGGEAGLCRPFVQVHALARPIEKRRLCVQKLTDAVAAALDLPPSVPAVYLFDSPSDHIAHGGILACDEAGG